MRHADGVAWRQQFGVHHVERRNDAALTQRHLDARLCFEAFRAADVAISTHVDHILLLCVYAQRPQAQCVRIHGWIPII